MTFRCNSGRRPWRPKTVATRMWALRSISAWMCNPPGMAPTTLQQMTKDHVQRWRLGLSGMPETIQSQVAAIRGVGKWMTVMDLRPDDPTVVLEYPKIPEAMPRPVENRFYDLALACALAYPEMYMWLLLMGCCGLRCCEIAWLRTSDVEALDDGGLVLHVLGKGGKRRPVPTGTSIAACLKPFLTSPGPVFTRPSDGKAHEPQGVSYHAGKFLRSIWEASPDITGAAPTPHQLRHNFGTGYHALDSDLFRQARLMGHASILTTQRYTVVSPLEAAEHIERMVRRRTRRAS